MLTALIVCMVNPSPIPQHGLFLPLALVRSDIVHGELKFPGFRVVYLAAAGRYVALGAFERLSQWPKMIFFAA